MSFNISTDDVKWLNEKYPDLSFHLGAPSTIKGLFKFDAVYKNKGRNHQRIIDAYEIEITFLDKPPSILPQVREVGGRIKETKEKFKKDSFAGVHINPDDTVCLCTYPEEKMKLPDGFNLKDFFGVLLIPYFYAQSRFEKTGKWIWGERSHGTLGLLESYLNYRDKENLDLVKEYVDDLKHLSDSKPFFKLLLKNDQIKGHVDCYCGSKLEFRKCHKDAFCGFWNLREDIRNVGHKIT